MPWPMAHGRQRHNSTTGRYGGLSCGPSHSWWPHNTARGLDEAKVKKNLQMTKGESKKAAHQV
jgi:hypothetical protein